MGIYCTYKSPFELKTLRRDYRDSMYVRSSVIHFIQVPVAAFILQGRRGSGVTRMALCTYTPSDWSLFCRHVGMCNVV